MENPNIGSQSPAVTVQQQSWETVLALITTTSAQLNDRLAQIDSKLEFLPNIMRTLNDHYNRLDSLEQTVINSATASSASDNKLTVSGIPPTVGDDPTSIVERVFTALNTQNLMSHVLSVRPLVRKDTAPTQSSQRAGSAAVTTRLSFIVTLTS